MPLSFEWDEAKAESNIEKHGVSFEDAKSVFWDEAALLLADDDHSDHEERFHLLGLDADSKELVVCHCYRRDDDVVRIVSARRAERWEQRIYWEERTR